MMVEFAFGEAGDISRGTMGTALAWLGGEPREAVIAAPGPAESAEGIWLWRGSSDIAGFARLDPRQDLEGETARIYSAMLHACGGLNLYRIWNIVPSINGRPRSGPENYHAFCRARSLAFESVFGPGFSRNLPAASAVGTHGAELAVAFLAGARPTRHHENPAQVPAYHYPPEHGPRPPSFARATVVGDGATVDAFISGTSAVVGHETVAPNDTALQLVCTFENLGLISRACGLGDRFGAGASCRRHFKVYLRNAGDLESVTAEVGRALLAPGDRVTYLGAEICRSALNVEIEVTVRGADRI